MFRLFDITNKKRFFVEVDEDGYTDYMIDSKNNVYYLGCRCQLQLKKDIKIEWGVTLKLSGFREIDLYENDKVQIDNNIYYVGISSNNLFCFFNENHSNFFYFHDSHKKITKEMEVKVIGVKDI
jgi:hypothetical protein